LACGRSCQFGVEFGTRRFLLLNLRRKARQSRL
jgi:hypothetical protein